MTPHRTLVLLAACAATAACAHGGDERRAASPDATLDPRVRAKGEELAAYDRHQDARRREAIGRLASGTARDVTPNGATVERFLIHLINRGSHPIRRVDGGVIVYDAATLKRQGLATFSVPADVDPGRTADLPVAIPMAAFAEGAGPLAKTAGRPKTVELTLMAIGVEGAAGPAERD